MCMVLYGYDASTYNSVQASDNWLAWFNLTSVRAMCPYAHTCLHLFWLPRHGELCVDAKPTG